MSKDASLTVRLPPEVKAAMAKAAAADDRPISQWLLRLLVAHLKRAGHLPK